MPLASKTFQNEAAARRAMRALIAAGHPKSSVRLLRPMAGDAFTVSTEIDAADREAARILDAALAAPAVGAARDRIKANPLGALAAAFAAGYAARLFLR